MSGLDITGGRVLDPGRGIDATATVSIADGIITGVDVADGGRCGWHRRRSRWPWQRADGQ